jgi:hypothetical protein
MLPNLSQLTYHEVTDAFLDFDLGEATDGKVTDITNAAKKMLSALFKKIKPDKKAIPLILKLLKQLGKMNKPLMKSIARSFFAWKKRNGLSGSTSVSVVDDVFSRLEMTTGDACTLKDGRRNPECDEPGWQIFTFIVDFLFPRPPTKSLINMDDFSTAFSDFFSMFA